MRYESFSLHLEPSADGSYAVSVQSPQGEGRGTFQLAGIGELRGAASPPGAGRAAGSRDLTPRLAAPQAPALETGKELFRALFRGEVANLLHASLGSLRGPSQGLRIEVAIDPRLPGSARLQKLPWELLCRPETEDFLALSRRTTVVRSLAAHRERRPAIARPRRLRILAVAASPSDAPPLDLTRERANLEASWKGRQRKVEIVFLERGGLEEMRQALLAAPFHILHFMGHGAFDRESGEGGLVFEAGDGTSQTFTGRRLAQLLHDFASLRLVVLNACHTAKSVGAQGSNPFAGAASALVMGGVPAVVAMSGPVPDLTAVAFSRTFYQRLTAGDSIEAAVTEGRLAIQRVEPSDGAWATPALFLRSTDGRLFAPRSTVWLRRAALVSAFAVTLALLGILAGGLLRESRTSRGTGFVNEGIGFLKLGRNAKARGAFLSALQLSPDNPAALGNLAVAEMQLGDDEAALAHARRAVQAAPKEAVFQFNLGTLLARRKHYDEALLSLRRAVELDPESANACNELGNAYLELDRPAEAREAFKAGLRRDRTLAKLHKNLARVALAEGHPDEAVRHLETALPLYPPADPAGKTEGIYWLATAQAAAGHPPEACAALRRLRLLEPYPVSPFAKDAALLAKRERCILGSD
jgi:tetratricopeptide (TPR) repeat protein